MEDLLETHRPLAEAKEQALKMDISDDVHCTVDTKLFGRALSNIVLNAIQNSPPRATIRIAAEESDATIAANGEVVSGRIRLSVENDGVHIPEEILPKLFEPFFRVDEARTSGTSRSGVGLTIVKKALELMHVPYALENTEGGVRFTMDIEGD
jgi:two-component system sensor histidine kinase VanS